MPYELPNKDELSDAYKALLATLGNKIGPYVQDYGQLIEKGSPLNNQYQQLKSNISQHIPSNADFRSPQAMSEWAQAAALNAPMGLAAKTKSLLNNDGFLYHGTGEGAFRKILNDGLIPANNNKLYATNNPAYAESYAARKGAPFGNRVLRFKNDGFIQDTSNKGGDFISNNKVSPEKIELLHNNKWIQLKDYFDESIGIEKRKGLPSTPFSRAHDVAQKNAALPIEQGGLGLPLNNTAMDRARAMGFDMDAYHGTPNLSEINNLDTNIDSGRIMGNYSTIDPEYASKYTKIKGAQSGQVLPLKINMKDYGNRKTIDEIGYGLTPEEAKNIIKSKGYQGIDDKFMNEIISFEPKNIRSRFAAFDPMKKDSANILATTLMGMLLGSQYNQEEQ